MKFDKSQILKFLKVIFVDMRSHVMWYIAICSIKRKLCTSSTFFVNMLLSKSLITWLFWHFLLKMRESQIVFLDFYYQKVSTAKVLFQYLIQLNQSFSTIVWVCFSCCDKYWFFQLAKWVLKFVILTFDFFDNFRL